jgi:hypothetical protein
MDFITIRSHQHDQQKNYGTDNVQGMNSRKYIKERAGWITHKINLYWLRVVPSPTIVIPKRLKPKTVVMVIITFTFERLSFLADQYAHCMVILLTRITTVEIVNTAAYRNTPNYLLLRAQCRPRLMPQTT